MDILQTERLIVRTWSFEDFSAACELWGDPKVMELIDSRGGLDEDEVRKKLEEEVQTQRDHGVQYWALISKEMHTIVGCCGLRPHDADEGVYELGFHICRKHWGKGYAQEAARGVIDYAFSLLQAKKLFAGHHPENAVSKRILKKLGFRYLKDHYYEPTGFNHPSYVLVKNENSFQEGA